MKKNKKYIKKLKKNHSKKLKKIAQMEKCIIAEFKEICVDVENESISKDCPIQFWKNSLMMMSCFAALEFAYILGVVI